MNNPLLTPFDVGGKLGKSVSWVQRMAANGDLPAHYIGRDLRFVDNEIDQWMKRQPMVSPKRRGRPKGKR